LEFDRDLTSVQEVRNLVAAAAKAQKEYAAFSQEQVDRIVKAVAEACAAQAERLAKMAVEETGFGVWQDKVLKNLLGSTMTYESIRDVRTIGILREDKAAGVTEIGVPMGVIAALIPSTNPTSTVMYKSLICLKAGNAIVISPHPNAKNCIIETWKLVADAARAAGAPDGLVQCITVPTMEGTSALLKHRDIGLILATGGEAMVRAAYSSGNPALGVGPGNGPAFIERSADIPNAVRRIFDSKTFDNGTICASEQSIVTESCIENRVVDEVQKQGGYFMSEEESTKLGSFLMRANGTMNPKIVGRTAEYIAQMAGIHVPAGTRVLVSRQTTVGRDNPYSREKLCPVLGFYVENSWESACSRCISILENEGTGHTMVIHSQDDHVIREFALKKPVMRLLVNTPGALGGTGAATGLQPALTLGCGAVGGSASSDNIGPLNLINIRRMAVGLRELSDLRKSTSAAVPSAQSAPAAGCSAGAPALRPEDIEAIARAVLARISNSRS